MKLALKSVVLLLITTLALSVLSVQGARPNVRVLLLPLFENYTAEANVLKNLTTTWSNENEIDIEIEFSNTLLVTEYLALLNLYLPTLKSDQYDLFQMDTIWPGDFIDYVQPLNDLVSKSHLSTHDQNALEGCMVKGNLVAIPFFGDYGIFYYRKDLLTKYNYSEPPKTWDQLEEMVTTIRAGEKNSTLHGLVTQLKPYEGLVCNVMEWLRGGNFGTIVERDTTISIQPNHPYYPGVLNMYKRWRRWIVDQIVAPDSITGTEIPSLDMWLKGSAIFMRNWPFAIKQTNEKATFPPSAWGFTTSPAEKEGLTGGSTLGGSVLVLNKYSKNVTAAAKVLEFLTSKEVQKARFLAFGQLPTIKDLFKDSEVCNALGNCELWSSINVVPRPSSFCAPKYAQVAEKIYTHTADIIRGYKQPEAGLSLMSKEIASILQIDVLGAPVYIKWDEPLGILFLTLTSICLVAIVVIGIILMLSYKNPAIQRYSPMFMVAMLAGLSLIYASMFTYVGVPTSSTCKSQPLLLAYGFGLTMSALLVKNWRIFKIFNNKYTNIKNIQNKDLFLRIFAVLLIETVLLVIWMVYDPPKPVYINLETARFWTCQSSDPAFNQAMTIALMVFNGIQVLFGVWLAYQTRNASARFGESKSIAIGTYNIFLCGVILVPLVYTDTLGVQFQYVFRSILILVPSSTLLFLFYVPVIYKLQHANGIGSQTSKFGSSGHPISGPSVAHSTVSTSAKDGPYRKGMMAYRHAKSEFWLRSAAWNNALVCYIIPEKVLILGNPDSKVTFAGHVILLKSISCTIVSTQDEYIFRAVINGTIFEFQTGTMAEIEEWIATFKQFVPVSKVSAALMAGPSTELSSVL